MFILVLTVLSLVVMVALLLPFNDATIKLLTVYDNVICVVFLLDFAMRLTRSDPKRAYLVDRRGLAGPAGLQSPPSASSD